MNQTMLRPTARTDLLDVIGPSASQMSPHPSGPDWDRSRFSEVHLPDRHIIQALEALRMVREKVGDPRSLSGVALISTAQHQLRDVPGVLRFVTDAWDATMRAMGSAPGRAAELGPVLTRLRDLESLVVAHQHAFARRLIELTMDGLAALSRCATPGELVSTVPRVATRLGFDRALFSTVSGGSWTPVTTHSVPDSPGITALGDSGSAAMRFALPPAALGERCAQVDAQTMLTHRDPDSGFTLWRRSRSKNFWMVPIVDRYRVVGLLHADCFAQDRLPSRLEVEALSRYCRQLPLILAESDRSCGLSRSGIGGTRTASYHHCAPAAAELPTSGAGIANRTESNAVALSEREDDVVRLMSEGLTNAQIGRRLTITEGTVKSHVKRILRKTGSSNRAEAVATWLTTGRTATTEDR